MKQYCPYCGVELDLATCETGAPFTCPTCSQVVALPNGTQDRGASGAQSIWQRLRRDYIVIAGNLLIALIILIILFFLLFFLANPIQSQPGKQIKKAIFGQRLAAAAERAARNAAQSGGQTRNQASPSNGQGENQQDRAGQDGQGAERNGNTAEASGQNGQNPRGENETGQLANEHGNELPGNNRTPRDRASVNAPANPQHPENQPSQSSFDQVAEFSIGRLQSLFEGIWPSSPTNRAGIAGTDEPGQGLGNTNQPGSYESEAPIADNPNTVEMAQSAYAPLPPEASRSTNIAPELPPQSAQTNVSLLSDDFSRRLIRAGARSGDVQISLMWNNVNDLDLHCVDPGGEEIYYSHRSSRSGGVLDIDMNVSRPLTAQPVENIYWRTQGAPNGLYKVYLNHYRNHGGRDPTQFVIRIMVKGRIQQFTGTINFGERKRLITQFIVGPAQPGTQPASPN